MTTTAGDPDGVTVRPVERADLLEISRIEKASFPQPWPFRAFEGFLEEPGFLVAERGGSVVGYVVADTVPNYGGRIGHVKDLAVDPGWRGRGIGTRLLERALSRLASGGVGRVKLEVRESNEGAFSLYRRFDFEPKRRLPRYYDDGEDAIVMVARLDG